jgi:outer membrane protein OmpA-like peptidoglycan-associated protein
MKFRLALAAATCLALPLAAHAQPVTGPYVSLEAGTSFQMKTSWTDAGIGGPLKGVYDYTPSFAGNIGVGYGFGDGFRVQLDGDFARNTVLDYRDNSGLENYTGGANKYGPMVNVLYDFNVGLPIFPYVGAGAGYQWVKFNSDLGGNGAQGDQIGGTHGRFAYDAIAGVAYPLAAVPGLSLTAEYRFLELVGNQNYNYPANIAGLEKEGASSSHTLLLGLRYQIFNAPVMAPAPAPMAAPAPAEARTYLVFFDWDKYNLTPRATQIIAQAAADSKTQTTTTLDVSGYTDTSGTPVYNQGLSLRRAKAVAAKLVVDGVPAAEIEIHAYGETHLLVPTGPGVREPQNRRVEIVLN